FAELFEINNLKAQAQAKDTVILKLKEKLNFLNGDVKDRNLKRKVEEIETLNIELDHKVTKLAAENEHLKQAYKKLYDSVKSSRVRSKEQSFKVQLNKLKSKAVLTEAVSLHPINPELLKVDVAPLVPKLHKNMTAHTDYIRHTQEEAATLREIVESKRLLSPLNTSLVYAWTKLVAAAPKNKTNQIRDTEQVTKSERTTVTTPPSTNSDSNTPMFSSTGVNLVSSASGSMTVKSSLNKTSVVDSKSTLYVIHSVTNVNSDLKRASCNGCLLSDNHDACVVAYKNSVHASKKSKSVKTPVKRKVWKTTGKIVKSVGHIWKPTGRIFTLVGNVCPLTRIATPTIMPPREPIPIVNSTDKPVVTLVYSRKPKSKKVSNKMEPNTPWGSSSSNVTSSLFAYRLSKSSSAFRQHTCFIRNLDGVDLLTVSRGNNLYTLSIQDMMASSPICLLSKASKTKSWLWHRRLSHLNFGAINHLARKGLVRGLPKLKFEKDHLCSACAMGKSTRKTHKPKSEDTNQEKLYLLHMDLCGPMRVESVNRRKYILVIVDDYSRFTWQNGVVERRNHTLIEAARTMLIYTQAPLFLWAEAVATACFTQNRSIIRLRHGKTPYELLHSKLPDLSFYHVFGALCYPTNDSENLGKLQPKADIEIFIGYAPTKKAFRIYNQRTRRIVETIHVDFDELTAMASEHRSSGPALNEMTPRTISSGLVHTTSPSTSYVPPSRKDWDLLFQLMFDELLNPPPSVVNQTPKAIAPIAEVIPPGYVDSTGSPSLTTVEQDAPSTSNSPTPTETQSSVIPQDDGDDNLDMEITHMRNDPLFGVPIPEVTYAQSTTPASPQAIVQTNHPIPHHNSKWTKDHPL
nr:integrase, catalytic region, zinc finger, CCHC-type, peptidase aspartic, catalytic [Tanacetum cinerariifolium]